MVSISERVREIRRIGVEAKRTGGLGGPPPAPWKLMTVGAVLIAVNVMTWASAIVGYARGGRDSGAGGGPHQTQRGQAGVSSGLAPSGVSSGGGATSVEGQFRVFYGGDTDLEKVDGQVLSSARKRVDLALHGGIDDALCRVVAGVAKSGVPVRLLAGRGAFAGDLAGSCADALSAGGVKLRIVPAAETLLLESYVVDDLKLRSGAADLTAAGERSDNADLVLVGSASAVALFEKQFDRLWDKAEDRGARGSAR